MDPSESRTRTAYFQVGAGLMAFASDFPAIEWLRSMSDTGKGVGYWAFFAAIVVANLGGTILMAVGLMALARDAKASDE